MRAGRRGVGPLNATAIVSLREDALHLSKLVDDLHLLALSDLQALPCTFAEFDAAAFIRQLVPRLQARAADKGLQLSVEIEIEAPLPVRWDSRRIEQLLGNVLENSLRYTDARGRVVLALQRHGEQVCIVIDDSAPDVPAADLPRLFEPLFRADAARTRHQGGSGLGLAICDTIVRSHGGRIHAAPSALGGLRLLIELPASAAGAAP